jgi:hypothetical protein
VYALARLCALMSALMSALAACSNPASLLNDPNLTRQLVEVADAISPSGAEGTRGASDDTSGDTSGAGERPPSDPSAWTCDGALTPPIGYQQETAFIPESNPLATQRAADRAREALLARLCDSRPCDGLSENLIIHKTGAGSGQVCAMVVVKNDRFEAWKQKQDLGPFDEALLRAAQEITKGVKAPLVSIDKILDAGAAGGARASWLEARMKAALLRAGGRYVEVPDGWDGQGMPAGVDILIRAETAERVERGDRVVDINWEAYTRAPKQGVRELRTSERVSFLAVAAPEMRSPVQALPPSDAKLSVRVESHKAGGLCPGELTSVKLFSADTLHVRVFNLYGQDSAILVYPPTREASDVVTANRVISLNGSEDRFMVVPTPTSQVERFLVVAAKDPKDLGDFAKMRGYCKLSPGKARMLHKGQGLPASARAASDGFRLLPATECQDVPPPPAQAVEEAQQVLASLPECD